MKVAVVGCVHGELDRVYEELEAACKTRNITIDLVLICGDFQAVRNENDMQCMAIPRKYWALGSFHQYYKGVKKAPFLTLFVGGNHETSNYLFTLPYGGWVAPNIYYMGYGMVVNFGGLRIGGFSGIFKKHDSYGGHYERLPFDGSSTRSVFHCRELEFFRFLQMKNEWQEKNPIDIFLSHDWPLGIHSMGNEQQLLRAKPHFRQDMKENRLGNPFHQTLLNFLKPKHWFSAHLHVRFEAFVPHSQQIGTKFLALDKCLGRRRYFEVMDINPNVEGEKVLTYDPEWCAILKATDQYMTIEKNINPRIPLKEEVSINPTEEEMNQIKHLFSNDLKTPDNFAQTEPVVGDTDSDPRRQRNFSNPQTELLCSILGIKNPMALILNAPNAPNAPNVVPNFQPPPQPNFPPIHTRSKLVLPPVRNPDEINLDLDDEDEDGEQENGENKGEDEGVGGESEGKVRDEVMVKEIDGKNPINKPDPPTESGVDSVVEDDKLIDKGKEEHMFQEGDVVTFEQEGEPKQEGDSEESSTKKVKLDLETTIDGETC